MVESITPYKKMSEDKKDSDMVYVMQVDQNSVSKINDIIKSLELSHFKVVPDKKKSH